MWKFVARGIRESLIGRRTCSNIYPQSAQESSTDSNHDRKPISKTKSCTFPVYFRCCGNAKYSGTKDKEKNDKWDAKYSWTEAVGWSSILAIGWVVCQSMCLQRKLFERGNVNYLEKWRHKLLVTPQYQPSKIFKNFLLPQSNYLLAKPQEPSKFSINEQVLVDEAPNIAKPYGPVTAEKALEEAVNEFASTHNSILGELELDFGTKAIEEKRYDDAVTHFINGVDFSSIGSMFNLGLCHELGLGTSVDFKKAAIYYKKAAEEGHADAMYNLAVFHAQGKGGLTEDLNEARDLFRQAAKKGHVQAKKALKLENTFKKPNLEYSSDYNLQVKTLSNIQNNVVTKLINYNHDLGYETDEKFYSDNNLKEKTPTEIFLEMLGIREKQNAIPIINLKNNF